MKFLLYIGAFLSLIGCLWAVYDKGGDARESKIRLEIALKDNKAFDNAYKKIIELQKQLHEDENDIIHEPKSEIRPSDPVIQRYYERLRLRRAKSEQ